MVTSRSLTAAVVLLLVLAPIATASGDDDVTLRARLASARMTLAQASAEAARTTGAPAIIARHRIRDDRLEIEVVVLETEARRTLRYDAATGRPLADPPVRRSRSKEIRLRTGLRLAVLESKIRRRLISTDTPYGFKVSRVAADSPAAAAGLKRGDILLECNGEPLKTLGDLRRILRAVPPGAEVSITYARRKEKRSVGDRRPWRTIEGMMTPADPQSAAAPTTPPTDLTERDDTAG